MQRLTCHNYYLQQKLSFSSVFYEVCDQAGREADDERSTVGLFRMWAEKIGSQHIICKEGAAAVTATPEREPFIYEQNKNCGEKMVDVQNTDVVTPAQHHTA